MITVQTVLPDHSRRLEMLRLEPGTSSDEASFIASTPGDYDITVRWHKFNLIENALHFIYHLDQSYKVEAERLARLAAELARNVPLSDP